MHLIIATNRWSEMRPWLRDVLGTPGVTRLKGVFRTEHDEWVVANRVRDEVTFGDTAYRRDSRVEVFAESLDWDEFETALAACRLPPRG